MVHLDIRERSGVADGNLGLAPSGACVFARTQRYAAAYTHKSPSRDPELRLLIERIAQFEGPDLLFVGPQKDSIENSTLAASLVKRRAATYTTWKNHDWWRHPRVIALWPSKSALQALDDVSSINALGVLTWGIDETTPWAAAVGATDLLGLASLPAPTISDPVVLGAMRGLTNSVNLSTGLVHPSDRDQAIETLRALRSRGHVLDGDAIEIWAVSVGWSYRHAAELGSMVRDIAAGKAKRTSSRGVSWKPSSETFDHWAEIGADGGWTAF
jgi:hypothetical protein